MIFTTVSLSVLVWRKSEEETSRDPDISPVGDHTTVFKSKSIRVQQLNLQSENVRVHEAVPCV